VFKPFGVLALLLCGAVAGCPGSFDPSGRHGGGRGDGSSGSTDLYLLPAEGTSVVIEVGTPIDLGVTSPDTAAPVVDSTAGTGQACGGSKACPSSSLLCVSGVCRAICGTPTGACQVTSTCSSSEACVGTSAGSYVCLPGVAVGQACGTTGALYCQNNSICASVNGGAYVCLPVCGTLGQACGSSGGKCVASGSCLFCSAA
jgi:hypothetical protein